MINFITYFHHLFSQSPSVWIMKTMISWQYLSNEFGWYLVLGSNSLWVFGVSVYLASETPATCFWTIFSRMFVKQTTLRYTDSVSLWSKGQACLLLITNDSGFLNSRFPYCRAIHHVGKYPLAFSALLFGNWGLGKLAPYADTLATACISFSIAAI